MKVLTVNAGSSSVKLSVLGSSDETLSQEDLSSTRVEDVAAALDSVLSGEPDVDAVGHRLVHGGTRLREATAIDDDVRDELEAVASYAPQHVPPALGALDVTRQRLPAVPHVACFDTAFHAGLTDVASTYALPAAWRRRWPQLRRFGFHGLSYASSVHRTARLLERDATGLQMVIVHLGGGCSACAVRDGRSVDTTMGFTPLEGLVMGTRSGTVDPGLLLWLLENGMPAEELADGLEHRSGLLGLSDGLSKDTRELVAAGREGNQAAQLAFDVFVHSLRRHVAAMASSLDRIDALVLTGEISESHPHVRESVCAGLGSLGIEPRLSDVTGRDAVLSDPAARVPVVSIQTREDLQIAAETRAVVAKRT